MKLLVKLEGSLKEHDMKIAFCQALAPIVERHMKKPVFLSFDRDEQTLVNKHGRQCTLSWIKQNHGTCYQLLHILIR